MQQKKSFHVKMEKVFFIVSQNWAIFPAIACTLVRYCKKMNVFRRRKKMKFALLTIVDAFYGFMSQKTSAIYSFQRMSFRVNKLHYY